MHIYIYIYISVCINTHLGIERMKLSVVSFILLYFILFYFVVNML